MLGSPARTPVGTVSSDVVHRLWDWRLLSGLPGHILLYLGAVGTVGMYLGAVGTVGMQLLGSHFAVELREDGKSWK